MAFSQNQLLALDLVGKNVLAFLQNNMTCIFTANRKYESNWNMIGGGYPVGNTVRIRKPVYVSSQQGNIATIQPLIEKYDELTINQFPCATFAFSANDLQRFLSDPLTNLYHPAALQLINQVDMYLAEQMALKCNRVVGSPGAGISGYGTVRQAVAMQSKYGVYGTKYSIFNPDGAADLQTAVQNNYYKDFNTKVSKDAIIDKIAGTLAYENQNLTVSTTGTFTQASPGSIVVDGANQTGSILNLEGFANSTTNVLKKGDIIYIANVFGVNTTSRNVIGYGAENLMTFVVTENVSSDGAGKAAVPIYPEIEGPYLSGTLENPYKNVSQLPADGATVGCIGVSSPGTSGFYGNNYVYSEDFITLACIPGPELLGAPYCKNFTDKDTGLSIQVTINFDNLTKQQVISFQMFYGATAFGDYATRIVS